MKLFKRDSSWQMVKTGLYIDPGGFGHVFPDEICAAIGWPYTKENYDLIVQVSRELMGGIEFAVHEREQN